MAAELVIVAYWGILTDPRPNPAKPANKISHEYVQFSVGVRLT